MPFAFDYGTQHFTAGTYTVKMLDMNVLSVSNNAETGWAIIQSDTEPGRSSDGYLIFRKYGNRYFLAEYHPANSQTSASVMQSKKERSVARDYASNKADQGRVRLALLQNGEALPQQGNFLPGQLRSKAGATEPVFPAFALCSLRPPLPNHVDKPHRHLGTSKRISPTMQFSPSLCA